MFYVYAIGTEDMLVPPYSRCYIGVTKDLKYRWSRHKISPYNVGEFIREHKLEPQKHMIVIFEGEQEDCYDIESKYRPFPMIGLNEASGGCGGSTIYTEERNKKISKKLKGRSKPKEQVEKQRAALLENGTHKGEKNSNAKVWILTSPSGFTYDITGNLSETCKKLNLLESSLRYNKNNQVPEPDMKGYGGYRAKSKESLEMRLNTTGWCLKEVAKAREVQVVAC